ncbi:flagellin [Brevinema andersonii]|uniref:Flagellin n=1 Tax=Brevinema andersonii TaxID=34097 RepID=A0A1I1DJJ8_BREAD|nr:flagellin [Brevinema andersonii]SFB75081.1 flagellin [Brevinema andersonii]
MIINNNISSIFANRQLTIVDGKLSKDMEQLSSGLRINKAGDDASGLAVSEKMRTQIRGLNQAMRNIQDATSFIQTTEGYLQEITNSLQRVRELSVQGANGIYTDEDRGYLNVEIGLVVDEIDRVAQTAQFNTLHMLDGRFAQATVPQEGEGANPAITGAGILFQIGPNQDNNVRTYISQLSAKGLGLRDNDGNVTIGTTTADQANSSIGLIDKALRETTSQRTELGAYQNRFESLYQGLYIAFENTTAAESRIRDTNMAKAVSELVKNQILTQSTVSMLAQANLKPQMLLTLLQ